MGELVYGHIRVFRAVDCYILLRHGLDGKDFTSD